MPLAIAPTKLIEQIALFTSAIPVATFPAVVGLDVKVTCLTLPFPPRGIDLIHRTYIGSLLRDYPNSLIAPGTVKFAFYDRTALAFLVATSICLRNQRLYYLSLRALRDG